jgi:hypothetical protein
MSLNNKFRLMLAKKEDREALPIYIRPETAPVWNKLKYGIFKTINKYSYDKPRTAKNCDQILSIAVDVDDITKDEQVKLIFAFTEPSSVVESKRGFHPYWNIKGDITHEERDFIMSILIPYMKADIKAKDISRFLRMEGYYHWKDSDDPYLVKLIYDNGPSYTYKELLNKLLRVADKPKTNRVFHTFNSSKVTAYDIFLKLGGRQLKKDEYRVHCPNTQNHKNGDKHPSLDIKQLPDKILFICRSQCNQEQVIEGLREKGLW